jgi:hypothetical protein
MSHLAILEHFHENNQILVVPHGSEQKNRLKSVISERNKLFAEKGQPEWSHYCEKCIRIFDDATGTPSREPSFILLLVSDITYDRWLLDMVRAIVSDGITIGHPCCNVAHCPEPLEHKRKRFCPGHEYLEGFCAVEGCNDPVVPDLLTCDDPKHREMFDTYQNRNGANFQLKKRLERTNVSNPPDEDILDEIQGNSDVPDEGIEVLDIKKQCDQKSVKGNRVLRARFGRRQTHSEQLMVRPCGIIIARATFYGSETVPQTVVSAPLI